MAQVDDSKLDYLGRGVDCREPKDTWLDKLDSYGGPKIRDLAPNNGNINPNLVKKDEINKGNENVESKKGVEGNLKVTPHRVLNLGGELKVKRDSGKTTKYRKESHSTRTVTMKDDTSQDPHIVKRDGTNHCTKYEKELSQFILERIDKLQTEASTKGGEEAICLGKMIKDLKEGDAVARLEEYVQHVRGSAKELCQPIWQTLADICCSFIEEKPYTHYVKSITLGASEHESCDSQDSNFDTSAGAHVMVVDVVDGSLKGGQQAVNKSNITSNVSRGKYNSDSGTVTAEEVIEAKMEPVSSLITKSQELKIIMERLLQYYSCADQGVLLGPFHVSCREQLRFGRERKIYWQVIGDEIYGTTTAREASTFYIRCNEEQFCHIIHETSEFQTQYFATVQRPFDTECPLKLVPYPKHEQDICFTLMSKTKQPVNVPQIEDEWKRRSPFFIKLPAGGVPIIGYLYKPTRYISVREINKKWKKKSKSGDMDSKVEVPASGATLDFKSGDKVNQDIESCDSDAKDEESKHTAVSGATSDIPSALKSEDAKETKEMQNRESVIEKLKYTTGSSATLDTDDKCVIAMQFYFTPVENIQGSRVTISSGPPPPPSRIESDSATGGDEAMHVRQEEEDDSDVWLKQAFIELVGREYVFPLPVRAVDIPDTNT